MDDFEVWYKHFKDAKWYLGRGGFKDQPEAEQFVFSRLNTWAGCEVKVVRASRVAVQVITITISAQTKPL